ncbi:hypothetical protein DYBT9623_02165 [Dyadobacter sp. CECT 9623]|uniref:AlgX/AlgJ SGNH hydrolase-like domain-containing protein n=1 Tax=Dyadobacter linearis TaxID=2823330 RepID=A0ABM8UPJ3_9BACT|nr:hypothetical protein [Dyadobacter sp. CECT 9623]CAG5069429.1 hypothetical protein DYBT9623_02165 [Dyadobacter sp. CECT 9623]
MKLLKYVVLVVGCLIWAVGQSQYLLTKVGEWHLIKDGYQYGDLYRLANLSKFKDQKDTCRGYTPPARPPHSKKVHLYIIGDSFSEKERVGPKDFVADKYTRVHWADYLHIKLDTTETNILLIESVERHFRQKMVAPIQVLIPDTATFISVVDPPGYMTQLDNAFNGTFTRDRLDAFLFQNDFFLTFKEWKADLQYKLFRRVNESVTLVNDDQDMVFYMDTDTSGITSSFTPAEDSEIDSIVRHLNTSAQFADSLGFEHVFLSIIPNKVSVLQPEYGVYNRLIERIYKHPELKMPTIDVLADFRQMGRHSYLKGDSHWTCEGQFLWLNKVNTEINRMVATTP